MDVGLLGPGGDMRSTECCSSYNNNYLYQNIFSISVLVIRLVSKYNFFLATPAYAPPSSNIRFVTITKKKLYYIKSLLILFCQWSISVKVFQGA